MLRFNCFLIIYFIATSSSASEILEKNWFINAINIPKISITKIEKELIVAVVDDGFRLSHQDLEGFIWKNTEEQSANGVDDDGNRYVDDIHGWDISDHDNDVQPSSDRIEAYYHGTHIAGIISRILTESLGAEAHNIIKILPVKVLSDDATTTYLKDAYKGVDYALNQGADIILTAWSMSTLSQYDSKILDKARDKDVLIVAAAGNVPEEKEQYPAAHSAIIAVSALDKNDKKTMEASFGQYVDLSAPGEAINSSGTFSDDDYSVRNGTSFAAAITTAAAILTKLENPSFTSEQIKICLISATDNLNQVAPIYAGKLGAGKLNITSAVKCDVLNNKKLSNHLLVKPRGYIRMIPELKNTKVVIAPEGRFKGLRLNIKSKEGEYLKGEILFYKKSDDKLELIKSYSLNELPNSLYFTHAEIAILLKDVSLEQSFNFLIEYKVETIDFTREYCRDTVYLDKEGVITDGSDEENYTYNTSCKWLIKAPEGKVVEFEFEEIDTEVSVDKIYFFNGKGTHEQIIAILSGSETPIVFKSWNNHVLMWFVTDRVNQGRGWKVKYSFVDE